MKYVSLFAGIGGFDLALNRLGHECVYANEWDKYAAQTYEKNFGTQQRQDGKKNYLPLQGHSGNSEATEWQSAGFCSGRIDTRDITTVPTADIPDHDLLVGGFPCQAFSIAGKRLGFNETRGTLFFEIARILRDKRPRYFLLENVKGLLSHDSGKTFSTILGVLSDLGYEYQWQVLNSKNFGVPQNRERVFIVGNLRGTSRPKIFPLTKSSEGNLKYAGGVISAREQWLKDGKTNSRNFSQGQRIYSVDGISQTLAGNAGGQGGKTGLYEVKKIANALDANYAKGDNRPNNKSGRTRVVMRQPLKFLQRNQKNIEGDYSFTVDGANTGGVKVGMQIRRLTPIECERLQGFPDNWTQGVSDTQRYKQLGNAVTVPVVEEIVKRIL